MWALPTAHDESLGVSHSDLISVYSEKKRFFFSFFGYMDGENVCFEVVLRVSGDIFESTQHFYRLLIDSPCMTMHAGTGVVEFTCRT